MEFKLFGFILILVSIIAFFHSLFQFIAADAESRHMKHPKLWATSLALDDDGGNFLLYLFNRRKHPVSDAREEDKNEKEKYKKRMKKALVLMIAGMIITMIL